MLDRIAAKPFWTRVALTGLGIYISVMALLVIAILILAEPSELAFPLIAVTPALILTSLLILVDAFWVSIIGVLLGAFGMLAFGTEAPMALASPDSFFDFIFGAALVPGVLLVLVGSIMSVIKRNSADAGSPGGVMALKGIVGVVVVVCLLSAVLTLVSKDSVSAADKQGAEMLSAKNTKFDTDSLSARKGGKIVIKNSDPFLHTFTVDDLDIDVRLKPGSEHLVELKSVPAGEYVFHCTITGHEEMKGTLTIK